MKLYCTNGVLVGIVRTETPPSAPVITIATGAITLLTDGRVTVFGDRETSCTRGASSPALSGYALGDVAKLTCTNGVLTAIVKISSPM